MSTPPRSASTRSAISAIASRSVRSHGYTCALPPASSTASAVSSSLSRPRATSTTVPPAAPMRRAVTAPMPDDAPVISATRLRTASSSESPMKASTRLSGYSGRLRPAALGRFRAFDTTPTGLPIRSSAVFAGFTVLLSSPSQCGSHSCSVLPAAPPRRLGDDLDAVGEGDGGRVEHEVEDAGLADVDAVEALEVRAPEAIHARRALLGRPAVDVLDEHRLRHARVRRSVEEDVQGVRMVAEQDRGAAPEDDAAARGGEGVHLLLDL